MKPPWQWTALARDLHAASAIMPQALRSGKPRQSPARSRFPLSGMKHYENVRSGWLGDPD
jgi:hypothetical protein